MTAKEMNELIEKYDSLNGELNYLISKESDLHIRSNLISFRAKVSCCFNGMLTDITYKIANKGE